MHFLKKKAKICKKNGQTLTRVENRNKKILIIHWKRSLCFIFSFHVWSFLFMHSISFKFIFLILFIYLTCQIHLFTLLFSIMHIFILFNLIFFLKYFRNFLRKIIFFWIIIKLFIILIRIYWEISLNNFA